MRRGTSLVVVLCIVVASFVVGLATDRILGALTRPAWRDLDELSNMLSIGMSRKTLVQCIGRAPSVVTDTLADNDLLPYQLYPLRREEVMLWMEYPWGIMAYVDTEDQRVTRLVLVRHQGGRPPVVRDWNPGVGNAGQSPILVPL